MSSVADLVDETTLKRLAGPSNYASGKRLFDMGVVELVEVTPLKVKAQVKDAASQSYVEVKLISALGRLIYSCECKSGTFCLHCAATAIATWQSHER